ncbi:MAG: hypothetical protein ABI130_00285 [Leifsonia sp.]
MTTRRELLIIAERYLDVLIRGGIDSLPLAASLRSTSNGRVTQLGSGEVWGRATRIPARQTFVDPETGGIAFFGVLTNATSAHASLVRRTWFYSVRLAVRDGQIREVEEISFEGTWAHYSADPGSVEMDPRFEAVLPLEELSSREELERIVEVYCAAVARTGSGEAVAFHPDARRTELGQPTTDDWNFPHSARGDFSDEGWRWQVSNLRSPVVDVARGVIVSIFALQLDEESNPLFSPTLVMEAFKIENGLIRRMFAVYHAGTGDDGWAGIESA